MKQKNLSRREFIVKTGAALSVATAGSLLMPNLAKAGLARTGAAQSDEGGLLPFLNPIRIRVALIHKDAVEQLDGARIARANAQDHSRRFCRFKGLELGVLNAKHGFGLGQKE